MEIDDQAKNHLFTAIRRGNAFLVLGGGASKSSKNRFGKDVALGDELAEILAKESGLPYNRESLKKVISACVPSIISNDQFFEILKKEYHQITPSQELGSLLKYS